MLSLSTEILPATNNLKKAVDEVASLNQNSSVKTIVFSSVDASSTFLDWGKFYSYQNYVFGSVGFYIASCRAGERKTLGTLPKKTSFNHMLPCCDSYENSNYAGALFITKEQTNPFSTLFFNPIITKNGVRVGCTCIFECSD